MSAGSGGQPQQKGFARSSLPSLVGAGHLGALSGLNASIEETNEEELLTPTIESCGGSEFVETSDKIKPKSNTSYVGAKRISLPTASSGQQTLLMRHPAVTTTNAACCAPKSSLRSGGQLINCSNQIRGPLHRLSLVSDNQETIGAQDNSLLEYKASLQPVYEPKHYIANCAPIQFIPLAQNLSKQGGKTSGQLQCACHQQQQQQHHHHHQKGSPAHTIKHQHSLPQEQQQQQPQAQVALQSSASSPQRVPEPTADKSPHRQQVRSACPQAAKPLTSSSDHLHSYHLQRGSCCPLHHHLTAGNAKPPLNVRRYSSASPYCPAPGAAVGVVAQQQQQQQFVSMARPRRLSILSQAACSTSCPHSSSQWNLICRQHQEAAGVSGTSNKQEESTARQASYDNNRGKIMKEVATSSNSRRHTLADVTVG